MEQAANKVSVLVHGENSIEYRHGQPVEIRVQRSSQTQIIGLNFKEAIELLDGLKLACKPKNKAREVLTTPLPMDQKAEALQSPSKAAEQLKSAFSPIARGDGTVTGYVEMFYVAHADKWVTIPGASRFIEAKDVDASLAALLPQEIR